MFVDRTAPIVAAGGEAQLLDASAPKPTSSAFQLLPVDPERARQADLMYRVLRDGEVRPASLRPFPGLTSNIPSMVDVYHPEVGVISAVTKPPAELAAQAAFVNDVARRVGVAHHYAQVAPRADGSALIEIVPGKTWKQAGVADIAQLDGKFREAWDRHAPQLSTMDRATRARVDRELVQFVDWMSAQGDRSPNNGLVDDARAGVTLFDNNRIGSETPWNPLRPWMPYAYTGHRPSWSGGTMYLSPEARSVIAANLPPEQIRAAHRILRDAPRTGMSIPQAAHLRYMGSHHFLERMLTRHASVLATGEMPYATGARSSLLALSQRVYALLGRA